MCREVLGVTVEGLVLDWKAGHRTAVKALLMPLADLDAFDSSASEQQVRTKLSEVMALANSPSLWAVLRLTTISNHHNGIKSSGPSSAILSSEL